MESEKTSWRPLGLLLICSILPRLYRIDSPYVTREDWGLAQLALYVRNYVEMGLVETKLLPVFGVIGGELVTYTNHPFLSEILNAGWCAVFGVNETAMRSFAVVWSLLTIMVVYRLGRQLWGHDTGLLAAGFYSFAPMSIYLGRTPNIEGPCYFFGLLGVSLAYDWDKRKDVRYLVAACVALGFSSWCDHFGIFFIPFLFLIAVYRRSPQLLLISAAPGLAYAVYLGYLMSTVGLGDLVYGASKYASPAIYWVQPGYYWLVFKRILWNYGGLPPLLALLGCVRLIQKRDKESALWLLPVIGLFVTDLFLSPGVIVVHVFRILFVAGPIALLAAYSIRSLSKKQTVGIVAICLALTVMPLRELFTDTNSADIEMSKQIREHTTDSDLLIGLPPHMAYYVGRKAVVSYAYTWVGEGVFKTPQDVFDRLLPFAEHEEYERLVLFTQFLLNPQTSIGQVDFSQTFDSVPGWQRVTKPGEDPQVWKRVKGDGVGVGD